MSLPVRAQDEETDLSSCTATACTSPDGEGGFDCWAGSAIEPCTCSSGDARPTGETQWYFGTLYHEYTCCTNASIAGITNQRGNVLGMMPHPEHAVEPAIGGTDGLALLGSLADFVQRRQGGA